MLSIPHLIIIFVVALVVFGPEKLPELARNLGKVMGEFRRATGDLRSTFEGHMRDLEREAEQRRIGGPGAAPTAVAGPATPSAPAVTPAEGIVPTLPPKSAIGTPSSAAEHPAEAATAGNPPSEPAADSGHPGLQPSAEKEN